MAAQDAAAAAWGIEQDGVKRGAVPPGGGVGGVSVAEGGLLVQAVKVFFDADETGVVMVKRGNVHFWCEFKQVAGFATRRSAGVKDVFAISRGEDGSGVLGRGVLNAGIAVAKAGDVRDVAALVQGDGLRVQRVGVGFGVFGEPGGAVVPRVQA